MGRAQPWIDAISNSYGLSLTPADRTRIYDGSDVDAQRSATERGQTVFFSAGNGNEGSFVTPNNTTYSSQEGPDWIVTVGAVSPPGDGYYCQRFQRLAAVRLLHRRRQARRHRGRRLGLPDRLRRHDRRRHRPQRVRRHLQRDAADRRHLRPRAADGAHCAGRPEPGADRRRRRNGPSVRLWRGSTRLRACRRRAHGRRAAQPPVPRRRALPRRRLGLHGRAPATRRSRRSVRRSSCPRVTAPTWARCARTAPPGLTSSSGVIDPLTGAGKELERPDGEHDWMVVDSYCRQKNWGSWSLGYFVDGHTPLPGADPAWPARRQREETCPAVRARPPQSCDFLPLSGSFVTYDEASGSAQPPPASPSRSLIATSASTASAACAPESRLPPPERASACS